MCWLLEMREYSFTFKYVKGKDNVVEDHLSRPVQFVVHQSNETWLGLSKEQFIAEQRKDATWQELIEYLNGGRIPGRKIPRATLDQFELVNGMLHFVRIGKDSSLNFVIAVSRHLT